MLASAQQEEETYRLVAAPSVDLPVVKVPPRSKPQIQAAVPVERVEAMPQKERFRLVMQGFEGSFKPIRRNILYRIGIMLVAGMIIVLPMLYIGLIVLLGWGVYWHATENTAIMTYGTGRGRVAAVLLYFAPIVTGIIAVLFMCKPLLARPSRKGRQISLSRGGQPLLYAFVEKICEAVRAPVPSRIDLNLNVNASASFGSGLTSLVKSDLILTIGMPLVAGMPLQQFAGVLAHELGHFSQGAAMRLTWIIHSINLWFSRVVFQRDEFDDWLVEASEEIDIRIGWVLYLARLVVFLSRGVLWVFMILSYILSSWFSRQMEFDADRYEARLAGSDTFAKTYFRMLELTVGIAHFSRAQHMANLSSNPLRDAVSYCDDLPDELRSILRHGMSQENGQWFDSHPPASQRIENAMKEKTPGIFKSDLPAEVVFQNFDGLCHSLLNLSTL